MGWLIALGVLFALAILPIGVAARYNADGPVVALIAGPVKIRLFPKVSKDKVKKEPKKEKPKETQKKAEKTTGKEMQEKGGSWTDFLPLVENVLDFLDDFRKKLRVNRLEVKLIMAGDDPCDLAENYGKAWIALGNLMPLLDNVFVIKKRDLEVECDFTASQTLVIARLEITITVGRVIWIALRHGIPSIIRLVKILNSRKGGATK